MCLQEGILTTPVSKRPTLLTIYTTLIIIKVLHFLTNNNLYAFTTLLSNVYTKFNVLEHWWDKLHNQLVNKHKLNVYCYYTSL